MPAHRKPVEVLELMGAFRHNPNRRRLRSPKSDEPIGDPPAFLTPEQAKAWREIVAKAPAGVLPGADCFIMELTASFVAKRREGGCLPAPEAAQLRMCLSAIGLTPSARSQVQAPETPPEVDDEFRRFAS
jgi:phage terminase small subunit